MNFLNFLLQLKTRQRILTQVCYSSGRVLRESPFTVEAAARGMFKPNKPVLEVLTQCLKSCLLVLQLTSSDLVPTSHDFYHITISSCWLVGYWVYVLFPKSLVYRIKFVTVLGYLPIPHKFEISFIAKISIAVINPQSSKLTHALRS
jgi:hypothetical protein